MHDPLWRALEAYEVGPGSAEQTFASRLARENRWSPAFAERVVGEYKRFAYLAVTAGHEVTPSDAVDQAWHLHLAYSRDYWQRFCPEILGRELHHGPTAGGSSERDRYFEQYARTLRSYEQAFGPAPADIWPAARRRFGRDPQAVRMHPADVIFLKDRTTMLTGVALALALMATGWLLGRL